MKTKPKIFHEDIPTDSPLFDFDIIASGLAAFLLRKTEGAKILGIHGPWGSGKTTLMNAVKKAIGPTRGKSTAIFIDFNAWKYQERQTLWRALILRVLGELREHQGDQAAIEEMEQSLYRAFEVQEHGPWQVNWRTLITEAVSIVLSFLKLDFIGTALNKAPGGIKTLFLGSKAGGSQSQESPAVDSDRVNKLLGVLERTTVTRHVEHVRCLEQFLSQFKTLMDNLTSEGKRVFVLIDDLDRCLPESALEVFEAIKLFLDADGCSYIVALDRSVIRNGLAVRYSAPGEAAQGQSLIDVDEYIEKTISLSFDVPRFTESDSLSLVEEYELPLVLERNALSLILNCLSHNPRRIKRFMNTLSLQLQIDKALVEKNKRGSIIQPYDSPQFLIFLKLLLISYRYSYLFKELLEDPELISRLQKIANSYQRQREEDEANARSKRRDLLALSEKPIIQQISFDEEFWQFMAIPPNLVDNLDTVKALLRWFRYTKQ